MLKYAFPLLILLFVLQPALATRGLNPDGDTIFLRRDLSGYSIKEIQRISGKKLSLKQKIAFRFVQRTEGRMRKLAEPDAHGNLSFIAALLLLGMLSLEFFPIHLTGIAAPLLFGIACALAILALWLGLRSKRKRGKTFRNMFGIIVGGGTILLAIILGISALTM